MPKKEPKADPRPDVTDELAKVIDDLNAAHVAVESGNKLAFSGKALGAMGTLVDLSLKVGEDLEADVPDGLLDRFSPRMRMLALVGAMMALAEDAKKKGFE